MTVLALAPQPLDFVAAMRAAVTGVNVVTTDGAGGRIGLTVSALASVSAEPEMLLVCIARRSPALAAVTTNGVFGVSLLGAHQAQVAEAFAGRGPERFDFAVGRWHPGATGAPLLDGAAARFDCIVASTVAAGSHVIVVGDVLAAEAGDAPPLAYSDGGYAVVSRAWPTSRSSERASSGSRRRTS